MPNKEPQISDPAAADLIEIGDYIAQNSMEHARLLVNEIYDAMYKLVAMPRMGSKRPDLSKDESLAFWIVRGHYMIIYRPDVEPVEIVRVLHTSRDIARILNET